MNKFSFIAMIRVDYSFPNVDEKKRSIIYDIIYDRSIEKFHGGWGDGSNNSGCFYISTKSAEALKEKLAEHGVVKYFTGYQEWIDDQDAIFDKVE